MMRRQLASRRGERGQVIVMCALSLLILLLFAGLAIDFGLAYLTKADLGKAVDAAALTGARYVAGGQTTAQNMAISAFNMNYPHPKGDTVQVTVPPFTIDSMGNKVLTVTATSTIQPYFLSLLPAFQTLNVSARAEARYARVKMTVVIDRTGSMTTSDPTNELPGAMINFITQFDNVTDTVALITFANNWTTDVPMNTGGFQAPVTAVANGIRARFNGGTFTDGALQEAFIEEEAPVSPPLTGNIVNVVVLFTDGQANTIQVPLTCSAKTSLQSGTWNVGGTDSAGDVDFMTTSNTYYQTHKCSNGITAYPLNSNPPNNSDCAGQTDNRQSACDGLFPSTLTGTNMPLTHANVTADAKNRAVLDTNNMRNNNIVVYTIGLGDFDDTLNTFMCEMANDPCPSYKSGNPMYNPALPVGQYVLAVNSTQLDAAFQEIANSIHLRLLQ
jgi:Flp pilus assembly protein TadG